MNRCSPAGALTIEVSGDAEHRDIRLRGDLDLCTAPRLRSTLHECAAMGTRLVVIDLAELRLLAVAGLHVLLDAHEVLGGSGARLLLARPQPHARRILRLAGVDTVLTIATDRPQPPPGTAPGEAAATVLGTV